ncbi:MAG: four-carbon acid sugar kinase family protein, partial [Burkholderiaceae bacterium]
AAELASMLAFADMAVVAPAFPDAGRCTRNGRQYVNGVALEDTEIWRHEGISGTADIPWMLSEHGVRSASLPLAQVRAGREALLKSMRDCLTQGLRAVVCDAETNEDLQRIAQASITLAPSVFWAGSAGLANYLPDAAGLAGRGGPAKKIEVAGSILTVVGSLSAVSREQAQVLFRKRTMSRMDIPADVLIGAERHPDWKTLQGRLGAVLERGGDMLLVISNDGQPDLRQGLVLCQALARLISPFAARIGGMVSTGGETTNALLSAMRSTGLGMAGEVQPGMPLSLTLGASSFPIITKAGAFGSAGSLVYGYDVLQRMRRPSGHGADMQKNNADASALQNQSV